MIILALSVAVLAGCGKRLIEEEPAVYFSEEPGEVPNGVTRFTATLAGKGGEATRALSSDGTATWAAGEEIAVYYKKSDGTYGTATASVESVDDSGGATITATLTDAADGGETTLVYPASLHNGSGGLDTDQLYNGQYGNLTGDNGISKLFDAAIGNGTLSVDGGTAVIAGKVKMENQLCICAFKLNSVGANISSGENQASKLYSGKTFNILCEDGTKYTITSDRSGLLETRGFQVNDIIYVAMLPYNGSLTCYMVDDEGRKFSTTTGSGTLQAGKFYSNIPLDLPKEFPYTIVAEDVTMSNVTSFIFSGKFSLSTGGSFPSGLVVTVSNGELVDENLRIYRLDGVDVKIGEDGESYAVSPNRGCTPRVIPVIFTFTDEDGVQTDVTANVTVIDDINFFSGG